MNKKTDALSMLKNHGGQIEHLKEKAKDKKIPDEFLKEHSYFKLLLETTRVINTSKDFNHLLELIVDSAITISKAERGFLMLFHRDGNLEFRVMRNIDKNTLEGEEFRISRSVVNQVLATGESIFLSDIYKDKKFKISESIVALGLHMVMCVPLKAKENLLGVIYIDSHSETENFTELERKILEAFAGQASIAAENCHLYDASVHDSLTGLYDYGYLRARLEEEIMRAAGYKKGSISFLMLDLDNFKSINDSYGHLFGNSMLVKVAESIRRTVRKYDIAARYGGDEFAVLMPDADAQDARYLATRLQKDVVDLKFSIGKQTLSTTVSIGISTFPIEKIVDSESIIVEADHALFIAKGKGKNEIAVFDLRREEKKLGAEIIGMSKVLDEVKATIAKFAPTDATILITGETGTGKELVTTLVHQQSARADKSLIVVNCGAIPDNLLESELFGYEKGAFTGAYRQHKGKFELAHAGTIFLDEIGELPLHLQVKLLRVLEQKEIDRIGGKSTIKLDVRVIAATNKNLEDEVKRGNFRKDLFYRLSVATIYLPPLRERSEDIEALSEYYLKQMNRRYQRKVLGFAKGAMEAMMHHAWPGNIRELIYRIERAVIMSTKQYLDENDFGLVLPKFKKVRPLRESRDEKEREIIVHALICNRWNITHAAKDLKITRKALKYLIRKHTVVKPV